VTDFFFEGKHLAFNRESYISWCKSMLNPQDFCFLDGCQISQIDDRKGVPGHQLLNFSCIFVPPAPFLGLLKLPLTSLRGSHVPILGGDAS